MRRKIATLAPVIAAAALPLVLPMTALTTAAATDEAPKPLPEPVVHTVQETGPPSDRLNLVILGDGYQWDQQSVFLADVDRNLAVMWATEPFRSYRDYINIYAVEIASIDYGVRCDPDGRVRHPDGTTRDTGEIEGPINAKNTALRMIFQNGCNDPLARGTVYGGSPVDCAAYQEYYPPGVNPCENGNAARNRIMNTYVAPHLGLPPNFHITNQNSPDFIQNVQTLAVFNTFTYGGIGGFHATTSGGSPQGPLISLHELGHSLGTMQDEYPYSSRPNPGPPHGNNEPSSFHHSRLSSEQMTATQAKWFRWLGEESESGGIIRGADPDGYESGLYNGSNVWRPSQHSIMRWIGFYWDQVGREHMVARLTGQRNRGEMSLVHTPVGEVPRNGVVWVEPMNPNYHELKVTWRLGGVDGNVVDTGNSRSLELGPLDLVPGTVVHVEVRDPVGPDGIDWVRNPSTGSSATNSGYNGPRFVQTREWTVGRHRVTPIPAPATVEFTGSTPTDRPLAGDEVVYVRTAHPADRVLSVTWRLDGEVISLPAFSRTFDLGEHNLPEGTYELTATVTDPANPSGDSDTLSWTVDNALPSASRTLSEPLTTLPGALEHPVYFDGWDMWLEPQDDRTGYDGEPYVVGELRLNEDGWFNYFGFPEQPMPESPFQFRHSGTDVKALTYGNLGTGGLSKATFEQFYGPDDPGGPFVPGYGTHKVEHRAIDPAGNIGSAQEYRATVLPGELPECTTTITESHNGNLVVNSGVTCLDGAWINGGVTVLANASLVATDSTISGTLISNGADVVQLFGTTVNGLTRIAGSQTAVVAAGTRFNSAVTLSDNAHVPHHEWAERFAQYGHEYGPILAANTVNGRLTCTGNSAPAHDFGAPNQVNGIASGDCSGL